MTDNEILGKLLTMATNTYGEVCRVKEKVEAIDRRQDDLFIALGSHCTKDDEIHAEADKRIGSLERTRARMKGGAGVASFFSAVAYAILQKWETVKGWIAP